MNPFNLVYAVFGGVVVTAGLLGATLTLVPIFPDKTAGTEMARSMDTGQAAAAPGIASTPVQTPAVAASETAHPAGSAAGTPSSVLRATLALPELPTADLPPRLPLRAGLETPAPPAGRANIQGAPAAQPEAHDTAPAQPPRIFRVADAVGPEESNALPVQPAQDVHRSTFGTPVAERKVLRISR